MYGRAHKIRSILVILPLILSFACLAGRLFYIQIIKSEFYSQLAASQHNLTVKLEPQRGTIYDRNMRRLAVSLQVYSVYGAPKDIEEKEAVAKLLGPILSLDKKFLSKRLRRDKAFVWLKRKVDDEEAERIKNLGLDEIGLLLECKRIYPGGKLASHILGFCDIDNEGIEGIELYYDNYLKGIPGWRATTKDGVGREIAALETDSVPPVDGYDLILTVDEIVQHIAERSLEAACKRWRASAGVIVVMNPRSGAILALANYPTFDLNNISPGQQEARRNRAVTDYFEPGSCFKIVTASAALEEGVVALDDRFYCEEGAYRVGGRTLHDFRPKGWLTFPEVIIQSSNIGTVKVAQQLGAEKLWRYARNFGFGEQTGVDLPGEVRGILREPAGWSGTSISSIPMGQEITATALQLVNAISCIANDGRLMRPRLVNLIRDKDGNLIKSFRPTVVRRVIGERTAQEIKKILTSVVEAGTGRQAQVAGYRAAGKTGTAQKVNPDEGGYSHTRFVASFIGFVPADDPVVSIAVVIDEPRGQHFGGVVAAPVFSEVARDILRYFETL